MAEYFFPLSRREEIAEDTLAFTFDTRGSGFSFRAGQHVDLTLIDPPATDAEGNNRTFSIASSPNEPASILIATRMRPTAFKNSLKIVPLGTRVKVAGPMGSLALHRDAARPAVMLAGGIGITLMRSMVIWAAEERLPHRIYLFYSNRTPQASAFLKDLESAQEENKNFTLVATITDSHDSDWKHESGRIDETTMKKSVPDLARAIFYLAGPPVMVGAMLGILARLDVDGDNIKTEEFTGY